MKNLFFILLFVLFPGMLFAANQTESNITVNLQSGLTDSFVDEVELTVEAIVSSLRNYSVEGEFHWDEPFEGTNTAEQVEGTFSGMDMVMVSDTVNSSIYRIDEDRYEVRNIYFREASKENVQELSIRFNQFGSFADLFFVDEIYSIAPFAGYNRTIESNNLTNFLQHLEENYNGRNVYDVVSTFAENAVILAGSVQNERRTLYRHDSPEEYAGMLRYVYNVNDDIDIRFSDMTFYAHPFDDQLFGVQVRQDWQTTSYSDEGYLFLVLEQNADESYDVHFRSWQPEPISPESYPQIEIKREAPMALVNLPVQYVGDQSVHSVPSEWVLVNYDELVFEQERRFNRNALWVVGGMALIATGSAILLSGGSSAPTNTPIPPAGGN